MPPLQVRVWRRYGQLRIYVSAGPDPVGWFDPRTGRSQLSQPQLDDEFWAAVRAECQRLSADGHIQEPVFPPRGQPGGRPGRPQICRSASRSPGRPSPGGPVRAALGGP